MWADILVVLLSVDYKHMISERASAKFAAAVNAITERAVLAGARFGLEIRDLADDSLIYETNAHDIFHAASTTKILTATYALTLLGQDFRFQTRVVRSGELDDVGTLHGNLILVASGDPNLSGRVTADDKLDFSDYDHSIGAPEAQPVDRNPLQIIEAFVRGVSGAGIRRVKGTVLVDVSIFPEGPLELGTSTTISPIIVNDNLIDIEVRAGMRAGDPVAYRVSPPSGYVRFVNRAITGEKDSVRSLTFSSEQRDGDGTASVIIAGTVPATETCLLGFRVESPSRFARTLFVEALAAAGIVVEGGLFGPSITEGAATPEAEVVFEHVSPPMVEVTKVLLKVSQNLHAEVLIPVIGANLRGVRGPDAAATGFDCAAEELKRWGVETFAVCQGDAAGAVGYLSPDFMCRFLVRIAASDIHQALVYGLPIMGHDGTLRDVQSASAAAGHVVAKTGTICYEDRLNKSLFYVAKGLAGYVSTKSGQRFAFATYLTNYPRGPAALLDPNHPGQVLGAVAAAIYENF